MGSSGGVPFFSCRSRCSDGAEEESAQVLALVLCKLLLTFE